MHFYDFNIGDYAKKTQHLTNDEDLAYRRLLDMYYDTEHPITHGLATLSRRLRIDENSIKNVMDEFFPNGINKHADEKIAEYHAYLERQKLNGSKGGRPTHKPTGNPVPTQNNPVPSQPLTTKPLTTNHKPILKSLSEYSDDFEWAWKEYPKRSGANKKETYRAWNARLKGGATVADMINGAVRYAEYCKALNTDPSYIKLPSTFFGLSEHYLTDWKITAVKLSTQDSLKRTGDLLTGRSRENEHFTIELD